MIPYRFTEFYDPPPDEERADAAWEARQERQLERVLDSLDYQVSADASHGHRHRAEGEAGEGTLF